MWGCSDNYFPKWMKVLLCYGGARDQHQLPELHACDHTAQLSNIQNTNRRRYFSTAVGGCVPLAPPHIWQLDGNLKLRISEHLTCMHARSHTVNFVSHWRCAVATSIINHFGFQIQVQKILKKKERKNSQDKKYSTQSRLIDR